MKRYKRYSPKSLEIISIIGALIIAIIVNDPIIRVGMDFGPYFIILLIGTILAFIAYKIQWQSIREYEKQNNKSDI